MKRLSNSFLALYVLYVLIGGAAFKYAVDRGANLRDDSTLPPVVILIVGFICGPLALRLALLPGRRPDGTPRKPSGVLIVLSLILIVSGFAGLPDLPTSRPIPVSVRAGFAAATPTTAPTSVPVAISPTVSPGPQADPIGDFVDLLRNLPRRVRVSFDSYIEREGK